MLMEDSLDTAKVYKIQPLGVNCNCTFIINLDSIDIADVKTDDVGSWKGTETRHSYFTMDKHNIPEFLRGNPASDQSHFAVIHRYFIHGTYSKFHRCIVEIQG